MNRFMLTVTVATAALLGAVNAASAQTILYNPPGVVSEKPLTLGQMIASRIDDKSATEFRDWLANSDIQGAFDVNKGYTAFVVVDSAFDPANPKHPVEHYIVNSRTGLTVMKGGNDVITAMNGDKLNISRIGTSYAVEGHRVNGVIKNPEGTIYLIGGPVSATL